MFLSRKNQYCENDYITKSNTQIQCDPYQITSGIFHRMETKNFLISMEIQTKSKEEIIELLAQYEEKENRLAKKRKWIAALITICILILFLYGKRF